MSDIIGFKYTGTKDNYNKFKAKLTSKGETISERFSKFIDEEIDEQEEFSATPSWYQDNLRDMLLSTDLSDVIKTGRYHVNFDNLEFIQGTGLEFEDRLNHAVYAAVYGFWARKIALKEGVPENQADIKYAYRLERFRYLIPKLVKVSYSLNLPLITLSDLKENQINTIISFECVIIGPAPIKLDIESGRYIQKVLIQELEQNAKHNNPRVIKCVVHGDHTKNIASGMRKRILGFYRVEEPINGEKIKSEKDLMIDVISLSDMEENIEYTLSQKEVSTAREFAEKDEQKYIDHLVSSFCPKIYGRELEKLALYLSLLGGSESLEMRKESHGMLIGEADTGKSELVKFANRIANKSSIIDGSNATGVGVLFALDEYNGIKILRSGAMILNNGGHLIIDEYDKMPKSEQKKLNQAMEQQRATYNKGGHIGNAETKTTIIASCNPENERWNNLKPIIDNMPFDASTISRYDWVIRLMHESTAQQESLKMKHIMAMKRGENIKTVDPQYLKGLLNYLRKQNPKFTPESEELLIKKFIEFKFMEQQDGSLPIETRQMEGIQRLCESYAKLTFRKNVDEVTVNKILSFYKQCLSTLGMKTEDGIHQVDMRGFSINRDEFFEETFNNLAKLNEDGFVYAHDLGSSLLENPKMFKTDKSIASFIENRKTSGWIFEPKLGIYQRQRKN